MVPSLSDGSFSTTWKLPTLLLLPSWHGNQAQLPHNMWTFYPTDMVLPHTYIPVSPGSCLREHSWVRQHGWKLTAKMVCLVCNPIASWARVVQNGLPPGCFLSWWASCNLLIADVPELEYQSMGERRWWQKCKPLPVHCYAWKKCSWKS